MQQAQSSAEKARAMAACHELLAEEQQESAVKQAKALRKKAKKHHRKAKKQTSDPSDLHTENAKQQHSTDLQYMDQADAFPESSISQHDGLEDCALIQQDTSSTSAAAEAAEYISDNTALLSHLCCPLTKVWLHI